MNKFLKVVEILPGRRKSTTVKDTNLLMPMAIPDHARNSVCEGSPTPNKQTKKSSIFDVVKKMMPFSSRKI